MRFNRHCFNKIKQFLTSYFVTLWISNARRNCKLGAYFFNIAFETYFQYSHVREVNICLWSEWLSFSRNRF